MEILLINWLYFTTLHCDFQFLGYENALEKYFEDL